MLVPGLRNTIALDFHLNESSLYWTDVVEDKIYRGKLSENGGKLYVQYTVYMNSGVLKCMNLRTFNPSKMNSDNRHINNHNMDLFNLLIVR